MAPQLAINTDGMNLEKETWDAFVVDIFRYLQLKLNKIAYNCI